ncbi:MAG: VIT1/CCC1 transporter family protein [Candidatus Bathyarchaeia archaeon]
MSKLFRKFFGKVRVYLHITKASGIARRYFVMNGFDGAMTVFGIVLGSWIAGVSKSEIIVLAGLGACLAMGLSGFFGALMTEKAERERHLKEMEEATNNNVDPIHYEAARFVTFYVALIDGLSPALTAIISLMPFILVSAELMLIWNAYVISLTLSLATLFLLGIYLGKVAKENGWLYGVAMLTVGAFTALIVFLIQLLWSA